MCTPGAAVKLEYFVVHAGGALLNSLASVAVHQSRRLRAQPALVIEAVG
jgi:hypothetical protein